MLPTPDTSHVPYERVYEPAEDSFLLLDTLSSPSETHFLSNRFRGHGQTTTAAAPLVVEIGTGSGVVLAFLNAHAGPIFGTRAVLTAGVDLNPFACAATRRTVLGAAARDGPGTCGAHLASLAGSLTSPLREGIVDVLVFNPPYVPTSEMPVRPETYPEPPSSAATAASTISGGGGGGGGGTGTKTTTFEDDSYLLALSYAGGKDGMETTEKVLEALPRTLSRRGCAYVLLCAGNRPDEVKRRVEEGLGAPWRAVTVGTSGKTAGREKLQIVRIWRDEEATADAEE
ncbi:hypothetical protein N3K66_007319 [Trichothecium roseum]|uniref:Uncharacterized protein n=1 Tax=Trichothecium roseum TaxID=47278 RepID=A0ACC0UTQ1_9HYPO|nr:hypothetical protein N3K66_007319 [Trichothecium roseum]